MKKETFENLLVFISAFFVIFVFLVSIIFISCDEAPQADSPKPVEQEKHTIRYLAKHTPSLEPDVYIIEVDSVQYVAVYECGVVKKEE